MSATPTPQHSQEQIPTDELVRRQGVRPWPPIDSLDHEDPFSSDEEYDEFLHDLYASRRSSAQ